MQGRKPLTLPNPDAANHENRPHDQLRLDPFLYRRGVEHDTNRSTERLGGKRVGELGSNDARVTVGSGDFAPDDANLGSSDLLLRLVDIRDLLAQVEVGGVGVINTLNLDQTRLGVGGVSVALIAQVTTLDV